MLITFSGLDGAGKSTLIKELKDILDHRGYQTIVLTMYDHVGFYPLIRFCRDGLKGWWRRGHAPAPGGPAVTNDPDRIGVAQAERGPLMKAIYGVVRSVFIKRVVLLADISLFLFYRLFLEKIGGRVMIMDRYFFDSLADVADGRRWGYVQTVLKGLSLPDLSLYIDVAPETAFARKGEYSVDYLRLRRAKYLHIFSRIPGSSVIPNDHFEQARDLMLQAVRQRMNGRWQ